MFARPVDGAMLFTSEAFISAEPARAITKGAMNMVRSRPGYFERWALNRAKLKGIQEALKAGRDVYLCSYAKSTRITPQTEIKATSNGLLVRHGKLFFDHSLCAIRVY